MRKLVVGFEGLLSKASQLRMLCGVLGVNIYIYIYISFVI